VYVCAFMQCACIYIRIYLHPCMHAHMHWWIQSYMYACMHACIHTYTFIHAVIDVYMHAQMHNLSHLKLFMYQTRAIKSILSRDTVSILLFSFLSFFLSLRLNPRFSFYRDTNPQGFLWGLGLSYRQYLWEIVVMNRYSFNEFARSVFFLSFLSW